MRRLNIKWKAAAFVSAVLLGTCLASATCMAAESDTITQDGGSASKPVYAVYESAGEEGDVTQPVTDGTGTATLPDGTTVTVSGVKMEGLYLKVYPITEETDGGEPWKWFSGLFQGKGTNMQPYDIWFEDAYGQVREITDTVQISISPAGKDYKNPVVYYQPVSGDPVDMGASFANGTVSFYTNHTSYYVLLEQITEKDNGADGETEGPSSQTTGNVSTDTTNTSDSKTDSPKTGDDTNIGLLIEIMAVSILIASGCIIAARKRKA